MMVLRPDNYDGAYDGGAVFATIWCEATVAIVAGDWLSFSPTDVSNPGAVAGETAIAADATGTTDNSNYDTFGVATQALASGTGFLQVQISGRRTLVNVDAAVDAGDSLCVGTTKGVAIEQIFDAATNANRRTIGRAVTAYSGGTSTVDIFLHPKFGGS